MAKVNKTPLGEQVMSTIVDTYTTITSLRDLHPNDKIHEVEGELHEQLLKFVIPKLGDVININQRRLPKAVTQANRELAALALKKRTLELAEVCYRYRQTKRIEQIIGGKTLHVTLLPDVPNGVGLEPGWEGSTGAFTDYAREVSGPVSTIILSYGDRPTNKIDLGRPRRLTLLPLVADMSPIGPLWGDDLNPAQPVMHFEVQ